MPLRSLRSAVHVAAAHASLSQSLGLSLFWVSDLLAIASIAPIFALAIAAGVVVAPALACARPAQSRMRPELSATGGVVKHIVEGGLVTWSSLLTNPFSTWRS